MNDLIGTIREHLNSGRPADDIVTSVSTAIEEHNKRASGEFETGDIVIYTETGVVLQLRAVHGDEGRVFAYGKVVGQDRELPIHNRADITLLASARSVSTYPEIGKFAVSFMNTVQTLEDAGWAVHAVTPECEDIIGFEAFRDGVRLDAAASIADPRRQL